MAQMVKNLPAMWKTWVQSLGQEDPLEKETATHSRFLAWKSHGWKRLAGYSPRAAKSGTELKQLSTHACRVSVPQGCHNKLYKLKSTEISSLTVLETRSLRSRCQQGWLPAEALSGSLFHASLQGPTLISIHNYWKTIALTVRTFVGKVISLVFNTLSRFLIAFLPRVECQRIGAFELWY